MPETEAEQSSPEMFYRGAIRRIYALIVLVSVAGALTLVYVQGSAWALGFLVGATASTLNFRWLHELVDSLGPGRKPRRGLGIWFSLRYLVFGLIGYILVRYFTVDVLAALTGLFVAVAAVLLELLYELIYVRA